MEVIKNETSEPVVCFVPSAISMDGLWYHHYPQDYAAPLFLLQLTLVIVTTRAIYAILEPLRQPRYIAEVIGGIFLGPTVMGQIPDFALTVFPLQSLLVLETIAQLGLIYFTFTIGVEVEPSVMNLSGTRGIVFAMTSTVVPFAIGSLSGLALYHRLDGQTDHGAFPTFLGVVLCLTAFSVVSRILGELKLLGTDIGRLAISSAVLTDSFAWMLLSIAIALGQNKGNLLASLWMVLSGLAFFGGSFLVLRPAVNWVVRRTPEGEEVDETYACAMLVGVLVWALLADALGTHAIFGAFMFGLVVPNGPLGEALIDMVEDFVAGVLLPLFFAISGLKTNLGSIKDPGAAMLLVLIVLLAGIAKVGGSAIVAFLYKMTLRDGFSVGLLMNTKGVIELIVLNIGKDKKILGEQSFTILVFMSVVETALVSPLVMAVVKPSRRLVPYKRRTVQWPKPESELRILACVHTTRNVPSTIALLDATHPTKRSPISVFALHLIELTNRSSAMLIVNNAVQADRHAHGHTNLGRLQTQSEHIMHAFETYEQLAGGVTVQPLAAYSPYPTMHEDVCNHAEEKRTALVILPFHKQQTVDGEMEVVHPAIRSFNQHVLSAAPCSVAIFVDRGLGAAARLPASSGSTSHHIMLLFFGGPDDREALAIVSRMTDHPSISLTVLRFVPATVPIKPHPPIFPKNHERVLTVSTDDDREQRLDDEHIADFRRRSAGMRDVEYVEKVTSNAEETVAAIREMGGGHDLYLVGRGQESALTTGLTDWSDCPELGPIGDLLASSDFTEKVSVLVVQRSISGGPEVDAIKNDAMMTPHSPERQVRLYLNKANFQNKNALTIEGI